jgi:hypothetical protein
MNIHFRFWMMIWCDGTCKTCNVDEERDIIINVGQCSGGKWEKGLARRDDQSTQPRGGNQLHAKERL